jgi:hypothetical protein
MDEFGNPTLIKIPCDHLTYNRGCSYCVDVYAFIAYGAKEGYSLCEDMCLALELGTDKEKQEAWGQMKSYYDKYSDYEPEYIGDEDLV